MKILSLILLVILITSCKSTPKERPVAGQLQISYTQTEVIVQLPPGQEHALSGQTLYLYSDQQANPIGRAPLVARMQPPGKPIKMGNVTITQSPVTQLVAQIPLPRYSSPHADPVCFYVKDSSGNIIPSTNHMSNQQGFTNAPWEETFAIASRVRGLEDTLKQVKRKQQTLFSDLNRAQQYAKNTPLLVNQQCTVPAHGPEPQAPFDQTYLSLKSKMSETLCIKQDMEGLSYVGKLRLLYLDRYAEFSADYDIYSKALNYVDSVLDAGQHSNGFPTVVAQSYDGKFYSPRCRGSACQIEDKLLKNGKHYRYLTQAFERCVSRVNNAINNKQNAFETQFRDWQSEPQRRFDECEQQLSLTQNAPAEIQQLQAKESKLTADLARFSKLRPRPINPNNNHVKAFHTSCAI